MARKGGTLSTLWEPRRRLGAIFEDLGDHEICGRKFENHYYFDH